MMIRSRIAKAAARWGHEEEAMTHVDDWLREAAGLTATPLRIELSDRIDDLIASEPSPQAYARVRVSRGAMLSSAAAALLGFAGCTGLASAAMAKPSPTWLAAPSASSPFTLLIGR